MRVLQRLSLVISLLAYLLFACASFAATDDENLLLQAKQHLEKGEYYFATTWLERLMKSYPSTPHRKEVLLLMAKSYAASDRQEKAAKTLALLLKENPDAAKSLDGKLLKLAKEGAPAPSAVSATAVVKPAKLASKQLPATPTTSAADPEAAPREAARSAQSAAEAVVQAAAPSASPASSVQSVASPAPSPAVAVETRVPAEQPQAAAPAQVVASAGSSTGKVNADQAREERMALANKDAAASAPRVEYPPLSSEEEAAYTDKTVNFLSPAANKDVSEAASSAQKSEAKAPAEQPAAVQAKPATGRAEVAPRQQEGNAASPRKTSPAAGPAPVAKPAAASTKSAPVAKPAAASTKIAAVKPAPAKPATAVTVPSASKPARSAEAVLSAGQPLPPAAASADKGTAPRKGKVYALKIGEYVALSDMEEAKKKLQEAGVTAMVVQGPKKKVPMIRLLMEQASPVDEALARKQLDALQKADVSGMVLVGKDGKRRVYAGSFFNEKLAAKEQQRLAALGMKTSFQRVELPMPTWLLTAGRFPSREAALEEWTRLKKQGVEPAVIKAAK